MLCRELAALAPFVVGWLTRVEAVAFCITIFRNILPRVVVV